MLRLSCALLASLLLAGPALGQAAKPVKSPDGKLRAEAAGKAVSIFDAATGRKLITVAAHTKDVTVMVFSPDGKALFSGDTGGVVLRLDVRTGRLEWKSGGKSAVKTLSFDPAGKAVTAGLADGTSLKLDPATGKRK